MADQQSRGGKKQGGNAADPGHSQQHQGTRADGSHDDMRQDTGTGQAGQRKDDPSMAPESGDRKATG